MAKGFDEMGPILKRKIVKVMDFAEHWQAVSVFR